MATRFGNNRDNDLIGTALDDLLIGFGGADRLRGGAGNDQLRGGTGNDRLAGDAGNDQLEGDAGNDQLTGGTGNDRLLGGTGNDRLAGDDGNDVLAGGDGDDTLAGGAGSDALAGGAGADKLDGGIGRDDLRGDAGNDAYVIEHALDIDKSRADAGVDLVFASISYALGAQQENLTLTGSAALNATGNAFANILLGNARDNRLDGGAGVDRLRGGDGNDTLVYDIRDALLDGGRGTDTLLVTGQGARLNTAALRAVTDIEVIDLRGSGANALRVDAATVAALSTSTRQLRVRAGADDTVRLDGRWQAEGEITLQNVHFDRYRSVEGVEVQIERGADVLAGGILPLSGMNGHNGVRLSGVAAGGWTGAIIANAGDVNGDGYDDVIIGAHHAAAMAGGTVGASYVVFGGARGVSANLNLATLDGSNGFRIEGSRVGSSADTVVSSAGDINGDGYQDLLIGARYGFQEARQRDGDAYVVYGHSGAFSAHLSLATLDDSHGFRIVGAAHGDAMGGAIATAGDVNGDGYDDLLIGAQGADPGGRAEAGAAYVLFGQPHGFSATETLADVDGVRGMMMAGVDVADATGLAVSGAGDINGDGLADVIVATQVASPGGRSFAGVSYVVFGQAGEIAATLELADLDGGNGFRVPGLALRDRTGASVSAAGDVNGDGFGDLIIGASYAHVANLQSAGKSYVVFGHGGDFDASLNLDTLNGTNGFRIDGLASFDAAGFAVSAAGDINGDGYADLLVSAPFANPRGIGQAGETFVLFGQATGFSARFDLASIDGQNGLRLDGERGMDFSGVAVSAAGDVDGDGYDDLMLSASNAGLNDSARFGVTYIVFGRDFAAAVRFAGASAADNLTGSAADEVLIGGQGDDTLAGAAGSDVLKGGAGNDVLLFDPADRLLEGDRGVDTLRLGGAQLSLDLDAAGGPVLSGIEVIDLTGSGDNALYLRRASLLNLSDSSNSLRVDGNAGDSVVTDSGWLAAGTRDIDAHTYARYVQGAAELLVDIAVNRDAVGMIGELLVGDANGNVLIGGAGDDTYVVDNEADQVIEAFDAGSDSVQAAVTYSLPDNVENLILTGTAAIDATGNADNNLLRGNSGDNRLDGGTGNDTLQAGAGNDSLVYDAADSVIDGGFGKDTLIVAPGSELDLTTPADNRIHGIEVIALGNGGANHLRLAQSDVRALSTSSDTLQVTGEAGDSLTLDGAWTQLVDVTIDAQTHHQYLADGAIVQVDARIAVEVELAGMSLALLDGDNGWRLDGEIQPFGGSRPSAVGHAVSGAGDINGDGFDDVIVAASGRGADLYAYAGESYVVFGHADGFDASLSVAALDGTNGFSLPGIAAEGRSGYAVAGAGDVNGDGLADLVISAYGLSPDDKPQAGETYVVFGKSTAFSARFDFASLDGHNGFRIDGAAAQDGAGLDVSGGGDINGDGHADLLIGASRGAGGTTYVVFGQAAPFAAHMDLATLDGDNGFRLAGVAGANKSSVVISNAGDINGDGYADVIVGAYRVASGEHGRVGESYVVFGAADGFAASLSLEALDGSNGFRLTGLDAYDMSGRSVASAGDVNGDGFDDLLIGAPGGDIGEIGDAAYAGESYVVFGKATSFGPNVDLSQLDGANGFRITGAAGRVGSGAAVSGAGDVNGDGFADLLIGGSQVLPPDPWLPTGTVPPSDTDPRDGSYLVLGRADGFGASLDLGTLSGDQGLRFDGVVLNDHSGFAVSAAGDVNGDSFDDFLIGAPFAGVSGSGVPGQAYVVFGREFSAIGSIDGGAAADALLGTSADDVLRGAQGDDVLIGAAGRDVLHAGAGHDVLVFDSADRLVDGGSGIDTLRLDGVGQHLDLAATPGLRLTGLERIDLREADGNSLSLDRLSLLNLSDTSNTLTVAGGSGDVVVAHGAWLEANTVTLDNQSYARYVDGAAALLIDIDIHRSGVEVVGVLRVGDANDNVLSGGSGHDLLDGRGGNDHLTGGDGNDTYLVDAFDDVVIEGVDGGDDRMEASVSYTLPDNVETLVLSGVAAIDGTGNAADNRLEGNHANNRLDGGAGNDALYGRGGDDVLIYDAADRVINGGIGVDILQLNAGATLDLTALADDRLTGVEIISMLNGGANHLQLNAAEVAALVGAGATLRVGGEAGDVLNAGGPWTRGADVVIDAVTYEQYLHDGTRLQVQSGVHIDIVTDSMSLAYLHGDNGFRVVGVDDSDGLGTLVGSAGDVNGDGFDDFLLAAPRAGASDRPGVVYVVFGKDTGFDADVNPASLDGSNGFQVDALFTYAGDSGPVSAAGDINGDGYADLLFGLPNRSPDELFRGGQSHVLFGKAGGFSATVDVASLDGSDGFQINGVAPFDHSGSAVARAGDVNGDGFDDFLVSARNAKVGDDYLAGASYLVFGRGTGFAANFELNSLDGSTGPRFDGIGQRDYSGSAVDAAGDINGDGLADFIISAGGRPESYVVFGRQGGFPASVDLGSLDGVSGFRISGGTGANAGVGDVNGDGFDDLLVKADGLPFSAYLVFGHGEPFGASLDLALIDSGVAVGFDSGDGRAVDFHVGAAGDVNGDGYNDVLLGAPSSLYGISFRGLTYLVFGHGGGWTTPIQLAALNGYDGVRLDGAANGGFSGRSVDGAGDIDGDGYDDLIIGAPGASPVPLQNSNGESQVVFGRNFTLAAQRVGEHGADVLSGDGGDEVLLGAQGDDLLDGAGGSDVLRGGAGDDVLLFDAADRVVDGGAGRDTLRFASTGFSLDLRGADARHYTDIERIDLTGTGNNALTLDARSLLALSTTDNVLRVDGNGGDVVAATGRWLDAGVVVFNGTSYVRHVEGAAQLLVDTRIDRAAVDVVGVLLEGDGGDNNLVSGGGDDLLDGKAGVDSASGGAGNDVYVVDHADDLVIEGEDGGLDRVIASASYRLPDDVETLQLIGGAALDGTGNAGDNLLLGNDADNLLDGGAGRDTLQAGSGDDILVHDANDVLVDGGAGVDTLRVTANDVLDLSSVASADLRGIEVIDFANGLANTLMLTSQSLRDLSQTSDSLRVLGDSGDHVVAAGGWTQIAHVVIDNQTYRQYQQDGVTLQISAGVDATLAVSGISMGLLDGVRGFSLTNTTIGTHTGDAVSDAGDINGDGFGDIIVGARFARPRGDYSAGESYVVFGRAAGFAANLSTATLDGSNGFRLDGATVGELSGWSVSGAGDINGDGFDDLLVGAPLGDPAGHPDAGKAYVVYGKGGSFDANLNLASLNGGNGFRIVGALDNSWSGVAVSAAGDVNGDGFDDLMIGAQFASTSGGQAAGTTYLVFGGAQAFGASLALSSLNGANGFRLDGPELRGYSGGAISDAGDINGDGYDDFIIGAERGFYGDPARPGTTYVVFGHGGGFSGNLNLHDINGVNGFRFAGVVTGGSSGRSVSGAGDINGDGFDDLIVGEPAASLGGASYILFGHAGSFTATFDVSTLDGSNGFRIRGANFSDYSGASVSGAGDVNGDGYDDLLIGAPRASVGFQQVGVSYLVFGKANGFTASFDLGTLDGRNGVRLDGTGGGFGREVSGAGDINGDGFDDLLFGLPYGGQAAVMFGSDLADVVTQLGGDGNDSLTGTAADEILLGAQGQDALIGGGGSDVLKGGAGADILVFDADDRLVDGGTGIDTLRFDGAGEILDLGAVTGRHYTSIERVDLSGSGNNTLVLDLRDVLTLSDDSAVFIASNTHQLRVDGDAGDLVHLLIQGGVQQGSLNLDGSSYVSYTQSGVAAQLLIDADITLTIN